MENGSTACIVCATRGGAGSRAVQHQAIEYASKSGAQLIFLYVTDTGSMFGIDDLYYQRSKQNWIG